MNIPLFSEQAWRIRLNLDNGNISTNEIAVATFALVMVIATTVLIKNDRRSESYERDAHRRSECCRGRNSRK